MKKFKVAFQGLSLAFKDQAVLIQLCFATLAVIAAVLFEFDYLEWLILLSCVSVVITAEILNTCIERVCDLIDTSYNENIKKIKDMSSGAVLFASIVSLIIGCSMIINHLWR